MGIGLVLLTAGSVEAQVDCSFTIHLDDAVSVGSLQFDLDYSATGGDLNGSAGSVECADLTGSIATFFDDDAGTLDSAYLSFTGFTIKTNRRTTNEHLWTIITGRKQINQSTSCLPATITNSLFLFGRPAFVNDRLTRQIDHCIKLI